MAFWFDLIFSHGSLILLWDAMGKILKSNRLFNQNTQKGKPQINDFHGMSNENQEKKSALMICQHTKKMRQNS